MAALSWQEIRKKFLEGAEKYPDICAKWDAQQERWMLLQSGWVAPADPHAETLFKDCCRLAVNLIGKSPLVLASFHSWLDLMRTSKRGFRHRLMARRFHADFRRVMEAEEPIDTSDLPLSDNGTIPHVFKESADLCADLELREGINPTAIEQRAMAKGAVVDGFIDRIAGDAGFWQQKDDEFRKHAEKHFSLSVEWSSSFDIWTFRDGLPDSERLFKAVARKAARGFEGLHGPNSWKVWLDAMRKKEWAFQVKATGSHVISEGRWKSLIESGEIPPNVPPVWETVAIEPDGESPGGVEVSATLDEVLGSITGVFAASAEFCVELGSLCADPLPKSPRSFPDRLTLPNGGKNSEEPNRLSSTIKSLTAVKRMEAYLDEKGIGLTEFSVQVKITDRTLRTFRKSGSIRRSLFDAIAREMGMTREELLKPE